VETTNQSGGVLCRFAQGQNIDEPLAESTSSGIDYYEADGLGSITSLTNGVGTVAQSYTYDSFGKTTHSTGSLANPSPKWTCVALVGCESQNEVSTS
jgi:hypothetical protein